MEDINVRGESPLRTIKFRPAEEGQALTIQLNDTGAAVL